MTTHDANDYVTRVIDDMGCIDAAAWDALLATQERPTPFMRHAYLQALQSSGSAVAATGWRPSHLVVHRNNHLVAACALYQKSHSFGEYVFDWSWARAFEQHGRRYYPKLLSAVPFTPVPGTRLMAVDASARDALVRSLEQLARQEKLSSIHALLGDDADRCAFERAGWPIREGVQFHWSQPVDGPKYASFDAFTETLQRDKRKKIRQERNRVEQAGVTFRVLAGDDIDAGAWEFFYRCYANTYAEHGSSPYLTPSFFASTHEAMPELWVMFVASMGGQDIAASLVAVDRMQRVAYGRYWGALRAVPMLHFEACYYQPLRWCIECGIDRFEGGAQGEHKMARGLMPTPTFSAHWVAEASFARAVSEFVSREGQAVSDYVDELRERSPYKQGPDPSSTSSR